VGVKVYGSRHPVLKRTGDIAVAKIRKRRKVECPSLGGQRDGGEGRNLEPGNIKD